MKSTKNGSVFIAGAGPGDEDLITIKCLEAIKTAEVIVYDNLANSSLLRHARKDAELIYVGKKANQHTLKQEEINQLLVDKSLENKSVLRLKGGDPFVFGRGSEEALALVEHHIPFEVIPGITSGIAAPAYAGIPFTHRGYAVAAAFVTGHEDPTKNESEINWEHLATGVGTISFYMGVKNLPYIAAQLIQHGRDKNTPVALVRNGTYNSQSVLTGTLSDISEKAEKEGIKPPVITIVGEVVSLREQLRWFDNRPLFGKRIIITRSRNQASELSRQLHRLGADVVEMPSIDIQPVKDFSSIDASIADIEQYQWIIFTSVNGVEIFFDRLFANGKDSRALGKTRIAVIGSETGNLLAQYGIRPDLLPERFTSEGTVEAFKQLQPSYAGVKVLLPTSEIARDVIPSELRALGATVDSVAIYTNHLPEVTDEQIEEIFSREIDLVTFTSSSTAVNFLEILKRKNKLNNLSSLKGASIGPITTATAKKLGFNIVMESETHTIAALVESVAGYFKAETII